MRRASVLAVLVLGALLAAARAQAPPPSDETPEMFPAGPHREETFFACVACHNFKLTAAQGLTREKWDESLTWMSVKHTMPPLEGAERQKVLDYLSSSFPPRAPAAQGGWKNPFLN